jgi:hypothetical protein
VACINDIIKIVLYLTVLRTSQYNGMHFTEITKECYINIIPFQQDKKPLQYLPYNRIARVIALRSLWKYLQKHIYAHIYIHLYIPLLFECYTMHILSYINTSIW